MIKNILTREEQAKKTKRNQLIIGILLILLMSLSTVGYALSTRSDKDETNKIKYKDINFIKNSEYWYFTLNGQEFATKYNPEEVKNVSIGLLYSRLSDYSNEPLYFVSNFQDANFELKRNLYPFALRIQDACMNNVNCSVANLPIKNCSDNIIIIKEPVKGDKERINQEDNCIFINANFDNQTIYADAFLFKVLGIN